MRRIGYILGLLAAFASFALAQVLPDSAQQEAWQHFNQQHGGQVFIRWHVETGTPATIYGLSALILLHAASFAQGPDQKVAQNASIPPF